MKRQAHNKKEWPCLICAVCSNVFRVKVYRAQTAKYCSFRCKQRAAARAAGVVIAAKTRGTGVAGYVKRNGRHEHRLVAEAMIGRRLSPSEVVHHIDGNRHNNDPKNLQVITQSEHIALHRPEMLASRKQKHGY